MISREREAEILRLFHAERWKVGTVARQLGVHHSTVRRVLSQAGTAEGFRVERASIVDAYLPLIVDTLQKYPTLTASRLWAMAKERGYSGGPDYFRSVVSRYRPRRPVEAYQRLRTLPGEQAQVDWAHFGTVVVGQARRQLMAFVMVLSWSRHIFLRFYLNAQMSSFLRGHVAAFDFFGGVPRCLLYDNLKSAVLERRGDAIHFHPTLLELGAHYRYEPRPVAVARGNEKGRVERAIRYVRSSFFAARKWRDLNELNELALLWCRDTAGERQCPGEPTLRVLAAFEAERSQLLPLPPEPFPAQELVEVTSGKTPYVRFDLNDYSIPHEYVKRTLTLVADVDRVRILDGDLLLAEHQRSWGRRETQEVQAHVEALKDAKANAREHRGLDRLHHSVPSTRVLLQRCAERGENLGGVTTSLLRILETVGAAELESATADALQRGAAHVAGVRHILEQRRFQRGKPPPVGRHMPREAKAQFTITPHNLADYDKLGAAEDDDP